MNKSVWFSLLFLCAHVSLLPVHSETGAGKFVYRNKKDLLDNTFCLGDITAFTVSKDGATLVAGSIDGFISWWDLKTGQRVREMREYDCQVNALTLSPDETRLVSASEGGDLTFRDMKTLEIYDGNFQYEFSSVVFNHDGTLFADAGFGASASIYDFATRECIRVLKGHGNEVVSVAFSPDGALLSSGSWDGTVRIWNVQTGECLQVLRGHTDQVFSAAFSPDSSLLASVGADKVIRLWDTTTWQCIATLEGHTDDIESVAFNASGHYMLTASQDKTLGIWDVNLRMRVATLDMSCAVKQACFIGDSLSIAVLLDDCSELYIYDFVSLVPPSLATCALGKVKSQLSA
jgi:WD40 repeat protein